MKNIHQLDTQNKMAPFKSDCSKCRGLCCKAFAFSKIDGFPENKKTDYPCINLKSDDSCLVHAELKEKKLKGCLNYDCLGAGNRISPLLNQQLQKEDYELFRKATSLQQILFYLSEATLLTGNKNIALNIQEIEPLFKSREALSQADISLIQKKANQALIEVSKEMASLFHKKFDINRPLGGIAKNFSAKSLEGENCSMTLLIQSNFQGTKLLGTNFLGSDCRDANFKGCDLSNALFLTQQQINSMQGNKHTKLSPWLTRPSHWE